MRTPWICDLCLIYSSPQRSFRRWTVGISPLKILFSKSIKKMEKNDSLSSLWIRELKQIASLYLSFVKLPLFYSGLLLLFSGSGSVFAIFLIPNCNQCDNKAEEEEEAAGGSRRPDGTRAHTHSSSTLIHERFFSLTCRHSSSEAQVVKKHLGRLRTL